MTADKCKPAGVRNRRYLGQTLEEARKTFLARASRCARVARDDDDSNITKHSFNFHCCSSCCLSGQLSVATIATNFPLVTSFVL